MEPSANTEQDRPILEYRGAAARKPTLPIAAVLCSTGAVVLRLGILAVTCLHVIRGSATSLWIPMIALAIGFFVLWGAGLILAVLSLMRRQRPWLGVLSLLLLLGLPILIMKLEEYLKWYLQQ